MIEVNVRTLNGDTHHFSVADDTKVADFRGLIAEQVHIPVDRQRLIFQGRPLRNEQTLMEIGVHEKTIHAVEMPPGARPSTSNTANQGASTGHGRSGRRMFRGTPLPFSPFQQGPPPRINPMEQNRVRNFQLRERIRLTDKMLTMSETALKELDDPQLEASNSSQNQPTIHMNTGQPIVNRGSQGSANRANEAVQISELIPILDHLESALRDVTSRINPLREALQRASEMQANEEASELNVSPEIRRPIRMIPEALHHLSHALHGYSDINVMFAEGDEPVVNSNIPLGDLPIGTTLPPASQSANNSSRTTASSRQFPFVNVDPSTRSQGQHPFGQVLPPGMQMMTRTGAPTMGPIMGNRMPGGTFLRVGPMTQQSLGGANARSRSTGPPLRRPAQQPATPNADSTPDNDESNWQTDEEPSPEPNVTTTGGQHPPPPTAGMNNIFQQLVSQAVASSSNGGPGAASTTFTPVNIPGVGQGLFNITSMVVDMPETARAGATRTTNSTLGQTFPPSNSGTGVLQSNSRGPLPTPNTTEPDGSDAARSNGTPVAAPPSGPPPHPPLQLPPDIMQSIMASHRLSDPNLPCLSRHFTSNIARRNGQQVEIHQQVVELSVPILTMRGNLPPRPHHPPPTASRQPRTTAPSQPTQTSPAEGIIGLLSSLLSSDDGDDNEDASILTNVTNLISSNPSPNTSLWDLGQHALDGDAASRNAEDDAIEDVWFQISRTILSSLTLSSVFALLSGNEFHPHLAATAGPMRTLLRERLGLTSITETSVDRPSTLDTNRAVNTLLRHVVPVISDLETRFPNQGPGRICDDIDFTRSFERVLSDWLSQIIGFYASHPPHLLLTSTDRTDFGRRLVTEVLVPGEERCLALIWLCTRDQPSAMALVSSLSTAFIRGTIGMINTSIPTSEHVTIPVSAVNFVQSMLLNRVSARMGPPRTIRVTESQVSQNFVVRRSDHSAPKMAKIEAPADPSSSSRQQPVVAMPTKHEVTPPVVGRRNSVEQSRFAERRTARFVDPDRNLSNGRQ